MIDNYANTKTLYKYNANNICIEQTTYDLTTNQRKKQITITLDNNSLTTYTIKDITTTHYTYDHHNRIKQEEIITKARNNIKVDYTYDNYQRIKNISYNNKVKDNCIEQYTYDGTKIITYNSPYSETPDDITYDNKGRIKEIKGNNQQTRSYTYNTLGYLTKEKDETNEILYTYDNEANITRKQVYNLNNERINDIIYTYDEEDKNKLIQVTKHNQTINITYDEIGNTKSYNGITFEYTRGRLVSKAIKNNQTYSYTYNNENQRIKKETPNATTEYTYLNNKLIKEQVFVGEESLYEIDYIYTTNKRIGFEYNGNDYFYEYDILGNIIGIYDNNNNLKAKYTYDAYGNHQVYNNNNQIEEDDNFIGNINKIRYKGYYYDVETGLFYCNSRYYSPELCRWISPDSIEYLDPESINGLNLYCYCYNNPIMYADPSGCLPQWAMWLIGGVVIAGLAIATIATGGVAGFILAGALKGAVVGAVSGALVNGTISGISSAIDGEGFWSGFADGAAHGFMSGAVIGGITGAISSGLQVARAASYWDKGTFSSGYKSMKYHYTQEVINKGLTKGNSIVKYTSDAVKFANNNGMNFTLNLSRNGLQNSWSLSRYFGSGANGLYTSSGNIITFHYFYMW